MAPATRPNAMIEKAKPITNLCVYTYSCSSLA